jgi:hypothetical protein
MVFPHRVNYLGNQKLRRKHLVGIFQQTNKLGSLAALQSNFNSGTRVED